MNFIKDNSNDRKYFITTPRIVHMMCDPYQLKLWTCVKDVAGETGSCKIKTEDLAKLCRMSAGKLNQTRKELLSMGLLIGTKYKAGKNYAWSLSIPDLWKENIDWSQKYKTIQQRIHAMNSCGESVIRGTDSCGDYVKEDIKENIIKKNVYSFSITDKQAGELLMWKEKYPGAYQKGLSAVQKAPRPSYAYMLRVMKNEVEGVDWKAEFKKKRAEPKDYLQDEFSEYLEA